MVIERCDGCLRPRELVYTGLCASCVLSHRLDIVVAMELFDMLEDFDWDFDIYAVMADFVDLKRGDK